MMYEYANFLRLDGFLLDFCLGILYVNVRLQVSQQ